ncbi:glycosyltransferase [Nitrosopumilus sp.]|uniref:glycosyltransferase n=1 Tax=Nitrosopumilus sp. TaxID=2024843 RepID=UPI00292E4013|nr:glycosyltransferase [Nitrosopumilus sp.]
MKITFTGLVSILFILAIYPLQNSVSQIQNNNSDDTLSFSKITEKSAREQYEIFENMDESSRIYYENKYKDELSEFTYNENIHRLGFFKGVDNNQASGIAKILSDNGKLFLKLEQFIISDNQLDESNKISIFIITNDYREIPLEGKLRTHSDYSEHKIPNNISLNDIRLIEIRDNNQTTIVKIKLQNPNLFNEWLSIFPEQLFYAIPFTDASSITSGRIILSNISSDMDICSVDFSDKSRKIGYIEGQKGISTGRVETAIFENFLQVRVSTFNLSYDKNDYIKLTEDFDSSTKMVSTPDPYIFLTGGNNFSDRIEVGQLNDKRGSRTLCVEINPGILQQPLSDYNILHIVDKNNGVVLATTNLKAPYQFIDTSPELFIDWLQLFFIWDPFILILMLIFPLTLDYIILISKIIVTFVSRTKRKILHDSLYRPKITIMIPAHNEEAGLENAIKSVLGAEYNNKEIIVIDDGSTDNTYLIAKKFSDQGLIKLIHRNQASGSKATALNYGSAYATGDLILCMDGDTVIEPQSLHRMVDHFKEDTVVAVAGNVRIAGGDPGPDGKPVHNLLTKLQSYEYLVAMELGRRFSTLGFTTIVAIISGAFGVFRKNVFESVGKYDKDTITEDFDLTLKMLKRKDSGKNNIKFLGDAIAWTYCPSKLGVWIKQRERWAFGEYTTLRKHGIAKRDSPRTRPTKLSMFVFDFVLNILFIAYVIGLAIFSIFGVIDVHSLSNVIILTSLLFIIMEFVTFLFSNVLSTKKIYHLIWLVPIMALCYRPLLKFIIFKANLKAVFKKGIKWG